MAVGRSRHSRRGPQQQGRWPAGQRQGVAIPVRGDADSWQSRCAAMPVASDGPERERAPSWDASGQQAPAYTLPPEPLLLLTFQPGAPGPSSALRRSSRRVMAWGCPTGLGVLAVRKSLETALGQRSPSPRHGQRRGQIQSRARSRSARHGLQGWDVTAVPRAGTTSARAEAAVRASKSTASQPRPRTHPRGPHALGAANWAPLSPALALKKPPPLSGIGSSGLCGVSPEAPVPPSGDWSASGTGEPPSFGAQPPPAGLTGASAADGDAQLQASPGALGAGDGWAKGGLRGDHPARPPRDPPTAAPRGPGAPPPGGTRARRPHPRVPRAHPAARTRGPPTPPARTPRHPDTPHPPPPQGIQIPPTHPDPLVLSSRGTQNPSAPHIPMNPPTLHPYPQVPPTLEHPEPPSPQLWHHSEPPCSP